MLTCRLSLVGEDRGSVVEAVAVFWACVFASKKKGPNNGVKKVAF